MPSPCRLAISGDQGVARCREATGTHSAGGVRQALRSRSPHVGHAAHRKIDANSPPDVSDGSHIAMPRSPVNYFTRRGTGSAAEFCRPSLPPKLAAPACRQDAPVVIRQRRRQMLRAGFDPRQLGCLSCLGRHPLGRTRADWLVCRYQATVFAV